MSGYELGLAVLLVGGIVPAGYFTWTWRPARRWHAAELDAGGWVPIILALYLLSALRLVLGHSTEPRDVWGVVTSFVLGGAIDGVLWVRWWRWRTLRRQLRDDPSADSTT